MNGYFDYAATAPANIEIIKKVLKENNNTDLFGNPSCTHLFGIQCNSLHNKNRERLSKLINCEKDEIIFTSGGTESDNMAIKGIMLQYNPKSAELITSTIEHPAVLNTCKELEGFGYKIHYVKPNKEGIINSRDIESFINKKTKLISIMAVNNEIGTIQPIEEIGEIAKKYRVIFHSDMVQTVGLYPINFKSTNIDLASFSAHKFGGLKGTGFLYKNKNIKLKPIINGGGQEMNLRSGTENVFGETIMALSFEKTIEKWDKNKERIKKYENELLDKLYDRFNNDIILNGSKDLRVANNLNISFKNIDSFSLQLFLSNNGIQVSIGSACHSREESVSHVLKSINVSKDFIKGAIRITSPYNATKKDFDNLFDKIVGCVNFLKLK